MCFAETVACTFGCVYIRDDQQHIFSPMLKQLFVPSIAFIIFNCLIVDPSFSRDFPENFPSEKWSQGAVYLRSGERHEGRLLYVTDKELVLFQEKGKIVSYSSRELSQFTIFDERLSSQRIYISLQNRNKAKASGWFLETVIEGDMTLLRKEKTGADPDGFFNSDLNRFIGYSSAFAYYLLVNGKMYRISNFKKLYRQLAREFGSQVHEFIKQNHLKLNNINHQIKLIIFYNGLKGNQ